MMSVYNQSNNSFPSHSHSPKTSNEERPQSQKLGSINHRSKFSLTTDFIMPELTGGCTCGRIRYQLSLNSLDDARTTLCHCGACKRAMGGAFGLTAKVPLDMFKFFGGAKPKVFVADNGVYREFCDECGAFLVECMLCSTHNLYGIYTLTLI